MPTGLAGSQNLKLTYKSIMSHRFWGWREEITVQACMQHAYTLHIHCIYTLHKTGTMMISVPGKRGTQF